MSSSSSSVNDGSGEGSGSRGMSFLNKLQKFAEKADQTITRVANKVGDRVFGKPREELPVAPSHSGYLMKLSKNHHHARTRWFELRGTNLYFCKSHLDRRPSGLIDLTTLRVMFSYMTPALSAALRFEDRHRTYVLVDASSPPGDMTVIQAWKAAIQKALEEVGMPAPPTFDPHLPVVTPAIVPPGTVPAVLEYVPVPQADGRVMMVAVHSGEASTSRGSSAAVATSTPAPPPYAHAVIGGDPTMRPNPVQPQQRPPAPTAGGSVATAPAMTTSSPGVARTGARFDDGDDLFLDTSGATRPPPSRRTPQ